MAVIVIYVDGSMFESLYDVNYEVQSDGLLATSTSPKPSSKKFTYSGVNTLLGYSTSSSAVSPDTNFSVGDTGTISSSVTLYSVQQEPVDITISYKGSSIATMSASGTKTLETEGKYCEDDITVTYTKPAAPVPSLQTKSATYTPSTSQQTASITADAGYDGLDEVNVTVNAMPSGSATTPATTITANPSISVSSGGLITASVSASKSVTPTVSAGYVSTGTAGTVSVSGSNTSQLTTQAAQTITPTTTNQTIASGKYLTGVQTILGDANLLAENIKKDVVIFGITGTYEGDVPSGYTVTVSLTNPSGVSNFGEFQIYKTDSSWQWDSADLLGYITSPTGSLTVTVPSSAYGIHVWCYGSWVGDAISYATQTCTGDVSFYGYDHEGGANFVVTGDGTVTIDGIDWEWDY